MRAGAARRAWVSVVVMLAGAAVPGRGADDLGDAPESSPSPVPRTVAPTWAAAVGGPLAISGSAGIIVGRDPAGAGQCASPRGWLLQAEAGLGGAKLSAGPAFMYCYTPFGSLGAAALQAAFVRTWGSPLATRSGLDYAGGELDVGVADWKVTLGVLRRVGGGAFGAKTLFTWGIARGF
jgi:hypothetical protein